MTIRNPVEWTWDQLGHVASGLGSAGRAIGSLEQPRAGNAPSVRRIGMNDLRAAVRAGLADFGACRTDVVFLALIYPIAGIILARAAVSLDMLPLVFPLASGFVLVGPVAAVGLYELSRRRELGQPATWAAALGAARSPAIAGIALLGLILAAIFIAWLFTAQAIYAATLGPEPPATLSSFLGDVFTTQPGLIMMITGIGAGFLFAVVVLAISVVSFPLLLDQDVAVHTAVTTSVRAVLANPREMAAWGLFVAASLVLGSLPLFVGLILVIPVLGHATWHLYRRLVGRDLGSMRP